MIVPAAEVAAWRDRHGLAANGRLVVAIGPGAVGAGKAWPPEHYREAAQRLTKDGIEVWILGGPQEATLAAGLAAAAGAARA